MTYPANRSAISVVFGIVLLLCGPTQAQVTAEDCDTRNGWVDVEALGLDDEVDLANACVAGGFPLTGTLHSDVLKGITAAHSESIVLQPQMDDGERLNLIGMGPSCVSRLTFDAICARHPGLFSSPFDQMNQCPLQRMYEPVDAELINIAISRMVRWNLCTGYHASGLFNPLTIGPGTAGEITFEDTNPADGVDTKVLDTLTVKNLKVRFLKISDSVVRHDLRIDGTAADHIDLKNLVVLGDVLVSGSSAKSFAGQRLWVTGNIIIEGNRFQRATLDFIRATGKLSWHKNTSLAGESDYFSSSYVDVDGGVDATENLVEGGDTTKAAEYDAFLSGLKEQAATAQKLGTE